MKPLRLRLRPRLLPGRGSALASVLLAAFAASSVACSAAAPPARAPDVMAGPAEVMPMPSPLPASGAPMPMAELAAKAGEAPAREAPPAPKAATAPPSSTGPAPAGAKTSASEATADAPLIVYQGDLTVRVDAGEGPGAVDRIVAMAESLGGHLAGRDEGRVTVKIPSRRFREAMSQVDGDFDVERRNVKAEDVTAEFKDLEVRLENLRATRKRIEELMQKSGTLADTLSVERELERVASEIDRIQGRLRFLRTHTSFSTLTATVVEKPRAAPAVVAAKPPPVAKRDLALPLGWLNRVGIDTLVAVPPED